MSANSLPILAIDPGREKCGLALVSPQGEVLLRRIVTRRDVETEVLALLQSTPVARIVLGDATTSRQLHESLRQGLEAQGIDCPLEAVNETGSTLEARALYWQANPPRGWRRFVPLSLQVPPEPLDDFAAVVLARRFLQAQS